MYLKKLKGCLRDFVREFYADRPLAIACEFIFPVAASHSKKKKAGLWGTIYQQHNGGDVDNLLKPVADAMEKENWLEDDCQLAGKLGVKRYQHEGESCGTILTILG